MGKEINTNRGGSGARHYTDLGKSSGRRDLKTPKILREQYLFQRRAVRSDHPTVALRNKHSSGPWHSDSNYAP